MFTVLGPKISSKLHFLYASTQTCDGVATVEYAIKAARITGPVFIKDADNDFAHKIFGGNYVTYTSLVRQEGSAVSGTPVPLFFRPDLVDAVHKSYVSFFYDNVVSNVSYSTLISSDFCSGGWGFLRAEDFVSASSTLRNLLASSGLRKVGQNGSGDMRVVDVVWQLVCEGHLFFGLKIDKYRDFGSPGAWLAGLNARLGHALV
jgi:hypothetical protein